jgi:hypothetical protein
MFIKLSNRFILSTLFILIFVLIVIIISYFYNNSKYKKYEYLDNIMGEEIKQEYCNENYICGETCNIMYLPPNFKFDTHENVRDNIEDFFNIYLDALDVGCINDKIKKYIGPNLTMGRIFNQKNLSLSDFSPVTLAFMDNLYFSDSPVIGETRLNKYAGFKLVKQRINSLKTGALNYNLFYDGSFNMFLLNKNITSEQIAEKIKPRVEEILDRVSNNIKRIDRNEINNTNDCASDVCKIPISTIIGQDMTKKLGSTFNKVRELKNDLASNVDILKLLCEHSIVIDLLLKYYNINNVNDIVRVLRENNININNYNELRTIIQTNVAKLNSRNFTMQDFKRLLAVDNI